MTQTETSPRYETPRAKRSQVMARRIAGRALGLGAGASPEAVFSAVATEVGGYEPLDGDTGTQFRHGDAKPALRRGASDETIDSATNFVSSYDNSGDFDDATGKTFLESATVRTVRGERRTGEKAGTVRGKIAAKLVGHAIKGVGIHGHN